MALPNTMSEKNPTTRKLRKRLIQTLITLAVVAALTVLTMYRAQSAAEHQIAVGLVAQAVVSGNDKEDVIKKTLAGLLSDAGLKGGNFLTLANAQRHRELRVNWESFGKSDKAGFLKRAQLESRGTLIRSASLVKMGAIPRERSFELSGDHIVVVALDENDVVRWARLIFDPRSMRAEVGSTNAMHSEIYYRQKVDFIFQCPDDPGLARARFYRPVWNGGAATLELIGVVELH